jgi:hypothetical protein
LEGARPEGFPLAHHLLNPELGLRQELLGRPKVTDALLEEGKAALELDLPRLQLPYDSIQSPQSIFEGRTPLPPIGLRSFGSIRHS